MPDTNTGAELVRQALAAAKTPEEQAAVRQAVTEAAQQIRRELDADLDTESEYPETDPIAIARDHAIRELRAAAVDTTMRPPARASHLSLEELTMFEEELESVRQRAATIIRQSLRPPPPR